MSIDELVKEALCNAEENGFSFDFMSIEDIANDMIECCDICNNGEFSYEELLDALERHFK